MSSLMSRPRRSGHILLAGRFGGRGLNGRICRIGQVSPVVRRSGRELAIGWKALACGIERLLSKDADIFAISSFTSMLDVSSRETLSRKVLVAQFPACSTFRCHWPGSSIGHGEEELGISWLDRTEIGLRLAKRPGGRGVGGGVRPPGLTGNRGRCRLARL